MKKLILVIVLILIFGYPVSYYLSSETIKAVISDKERITTGTGEDMESKFLVYGEEEVFENTDSWLYFKFDSADVQNQIHLDKTNKIKVAGWRVPFFSWYRNVISVE
ncbi:DUF1523 family protein [Psychroflexus sp. CAK8W]|uniref:DUF1523 family protein n=1 Tax=Psychroflexus longus TaxID=2873596 RepID=A0ABS7XJF1_9FLAO|nr:DUF1523 family protein [Psychroflexus longus]MBZ9779100.1 DUF1523 family protein [Psychroflexus longus]